MGEIGVVALRLVFRSLAFLPQVTAARFLPGQGIADHDVGEFKKIGDPFLEFELLVWIVDVSLGQKVVTDLNFSVFATLSEAGFIPPLGPGSSIVTVQGLDTMQSAMGEIASSAGRISQIAKAGEVLGFGAPLARIEG